MQTPERSDPTFTVFLVATAIFLVALMYVTFPRHDEPGSVAPGTAGAGAKK